MAEIRYAVRQTLVRGLPSLLLAAALLGATAPTAGADDNHGGGTGSSSGGALTGTLYYTQYAVDSTGTSPQDNLRQATFSYDGSSFTLGATSGIAALPGADGLAAAPNGDLLVGGQNTGFVFEVNPSNGSTSQASVPSGSAFHVTVDPSGQVAWTAGLPGPVSEVPLNPFGTAASTIAITGDDTAITAIAFVGSQAFYTASGPQGTGNFGTINMSTFTTHRVLSGLPDAHGLTYDPFTKDLLMVGATTLTQIDPSTLTVVAQRTFSLPGTGPTDTLDQVNTDGAGHIFIAANDGILIFEDYSQTGKVDAAGNFVASQFLDNALDDVLASVTTTMGCSRDPDSNGDLHSDDHNGHGEDVSGNDKGHQKCDPDSNGDLHSNDHNGHGQG